MVAIGKTRGWIVILCDEVFKGSEWIRLWAYGVKGGIYYYHVDAAFEGFLVEILCNFIAFVFGKMTKCL